MPRKSMKARRRAYRKKPMWKKRGQRTTLVNTSLNPLPSRFITKMKYAEAVTVQASGIAGYKWNLNSLFDPNRSGIGHQPYGYDQLSALYNRYRVISCRYVVSCISDSVNIAFAVLPANESLSLIGTVSEARENPRAKYLVQTPTSGGTLKVLKGNVYLPALVGATKTAYMADDRYQAIVGNSPTELAILNAYAQGLNDDPSFNAQPTFNILLEYTVEWFDIITQDQS